MRKRKAQIIGQVFIFIMALLVAGLVILFGVSFIKDYLAKQDQVLLADFVRQVENDVKKTGYGSIEIDTFRFPKNYDEICFVDFEVTSVTDPGLNPRVSSEVATRGGVVSPEFNKDLFLINTQGTPDNTADDSIFSAAVGKVKVSDPKYYHCISSSQGTLKLRFEGVKGGVQVSEYVATG